MSDLSAIREEKKAPGAAALCWICNRNEANSGEHKTKRSDLAAVLGSPTQDQPFYFHDLERHNKPVKSLDAKILKAPIRICNACNSARTQSHDRAWEETSGRLRSRPLVIGRRVRANRIFRHDTRRQMINVHLFFLKLFGCMSWPSAYCTHRRDGGSIRALTQVPNASRSQTLGICAAWPPRIRRRMR
jgi:hypothetical protein